MKILFQTMLLFIFWFIVGVAVLAIIVKGQAQYDLAEQTKVFNSYAFSWDNFWNYMESYYLWVGIPFGIIGTIVTLVCRKKNNCI